EFEKQEKAGLEWLNKAVAQDFPPALCELSNLRRDGLKSLVRKSQEKANEQLLMKAANLGYVAANSELAQYCLLAEDGFEKNLRRLTSEPLLPNWDDNGFACHFYSQAVLELTEYLHDGCSANLGSNAVPAIMFWLRKSRDLGYEDAERLLEKGETICQSRCANCSKEAETGEKFKQCSKCKAQWYCSKECQVESWRAGHRKDCKRARILKFEDYLNAE
ncbi:hypothetical protein THAOC_30813, partial [Thalassiosira oceanica]